MVTAPTALIPARILLQIFPPTLNAAWHALLPVKAADIPAAVGLSVALKTAACVTLISPTPSTRVQGGPACSRQSTQDLMSLTVQAAIAAAAP